MGFVGMRRCELGVALRFGGDSFVREGRGAVPLSVGFRGVRCCVLVR